MSEVRLLELLRVIHVDQTVEIRHYSQNKPLYKGEAGQLKVKEISEWLDWSVWIVQVIEKDILHIDLKDRDDE